MHLHALINTLIFLLDVAAAAPQLTSESSTALSRCQSCPIWTKPCAPQCSYLRESLDHCSCDYKCYMTHGKHGYYDMIKYNVSEVKVCCASAC